VLAKLIDTGTG